MKHLYKISKKTDGLNENFKMGLLTICEYIQNKCATETGGKLKQNYIDALYEISDLIGFLNDGAKIYKFNDDFLNDYLNYPLNFDKLITSNSVNLQSKNIFICGKNLFEKEHNGKSFYFNLLNLSNHTDKNGNFIIVNFSSFDHLGNVKISFKTDENFNLTKPYLTEESTENKGIIKIIIKLLFYIQSSNVDLREITPEIPDKNATKKEKSRIDNNNFKNDSFIKYFRVGYSWNKLPIYTKDEWEVQGHFRMQACGKNHQEHKIVFVNPHTKKRQISGLTTTL